MAGAPSNMFHKGEFMLNKKIILIILIAFIIIILGIIGFYLWRKYTTGNLVITLNQSDIIYKLNNKEYNSSQDFKYLHMGRYKINAFGKYENYYFPKEFEVEIKSNQTTILNIILDLTPGNPDASGEEIDPSKK